LEGIVDLNLQRGFTLLELIVIVAIITILGAVAVPALSNMAKRDGVKSDVRKLKDAFFQAKMKAIELNSSVTMAFDCYGGDYIAFVDETESCKYDPSTDDILLEGNFEYSNYDVNKSDDGLTFVSNDNGYPAFRWGSRGYTHGASGGFGAGTAYVSGSGAKYKVVVSSTGNIRIESY
jgi:prepilin-type N-terminal cleavage/methylation domain-containing protein